ncbi:hypothetical protein GALMADRAFT_216998 [Galerina marginata CBS 339.88]|uniref:RNA-dependent RNA polymerase n=1 Tax=Galerina marginata (strain CBS 339.88) TaxID=685588 RepID=A0A067S6C3_GALM3|nr:hypothetical protein GALMADRAFT_216998 [Galerina marginata CBS 339.88]
MHKNEPRGAGPPKIFARYDVGGESKGNLNGPKIAAACLLALSPSMEVNIWNVPFDTDNWTVTRKVAAILHAEDFGAIVDGRLTNFRVILKESGKGGAHNGLGLLTLPTAQIGNKFLEYVSKQPISISKRKIKFSANSRKDHSLSPPKLVSTLLKTRYVDPDIEEERQRNVRALEEIRFRVNAVQFGVYHQVPEVKHSNAPRAFSVEWEWDCRSDDNVGTLEFDYDRQKIRIEAGDELKGSGTYKTLISLGISSIKKIGVGYDGNPYTCFDTLTPPVMERTRFHRSLTGTSEDHRKFKERVGSIHPGHAIVAPYAPQLRLVLYNDPAMDIGEEFSKACSIIGLSKSMIVNLTGSRLQIEASKNGFFQEKRLHKLRRVLGTFKWPIAFQLASLLHNGLLHTNPDQLGYEPSHPLFSRVRKLCLQKDASYVGDLLRYYNKALQVRPTNESPMDCFERVLKKFKFSPLRQTFRCYHVTFTPTRMILEGPYPSQSNSVIREYENSEDHFIRVEFRDEDRLQYRWDKEVDGSDFLENRVGETLKNGFELAGRRFEFLAYSNSALREHSFWFVNPFHQLVVGQTIEVNAASIRDSLGDFTPLLNQAYASLYAARLGQAFTDSNTSVYIPRKKWEEMPDIGQFTDGVGTISRALGDRIWEALPQSKNDPGAIKPSAYQIRFMGYKGMVAIDKQLDKNQGEIEMRLRPSMKKFDVKDDSMAPLEIAQAFEKPGKCCLNRPLVMLLEDLGVRQDVFVALQNKAVADAKTIHDSITQFYEFVARHNFGSSYGLGDTLLRLRDKYNMDLTSNGTSHALDSPFLHEVRQVMMTAVLRDIKHRATIPIPESYLLVGVADEGPAYVAAGHDNVYCLEEGEIYACIQNRGEAEPTWITGSVSISRSPVVHPGDVQRVRAIGEPPEGKLCLFSHLKNVVVLPSKGSRSLASCLAGGDVDGDKFSIICYEPLLPRTIEDPAAYDSEEKKEPEVLKKTSCTIDDVCDFIVEYIQSDILGLLSTRLLVIADNSTDGMRDKDCIKLAEFCSQAVDYPKRGIPPKIKPNQLPVSAMRCRPDWCSEEVVSPRNTDYYISPRALGVLFRSKELVIEETPPIPAKPLLDTLSDPISTALLPNVGKYLGDGAFIDDDCQTHIRNKVSILFQYYSDEMKYISGTHTLSNSPEVRLLEAEIVVGTILATCSQARWRKARTERMRHHSGELVKEVRGRLLDADTKEPSDWIQALELAWNAWSLGLRRRNEFGAHSFGIIALGVVLKCLDKMEELGISQ